MADENENSQSTENNNPLQKVENVTSSVGINSSFFDSIPKQGNVVIEETNTETEDEKATREALEKEAAEQGSGKTQAELDKEAEDKEKEEKEKKDASTSSATTSTSTNTEEEEESVIHVIAKAFEDVELEGEFEDTEEGILKATNQIVAAREKAAEGKGVEKLYEEIPVVKNVVEHLRQGGSLLTLMQEEAIEEFAAIELNDDNLDEAERIFRIGLSQKGLDNDLIDTLVGAARDDNSLIDKAKVSQDYLVKAQKEVVDKRIEQEKADRIADEKAQEKEVQSIKAIIGSKKILHFEIDDATAVKFEKFALSDARQKAYDELTTEEWAALDLIVMEKFKTVNGGKEATPSKKAIKFVVKKATPVGDKLNGGTNTAASTIKELNIRDARELFGGGK